MALEPDRWSRWLLERRDVGAGDGLIGLAPLERVGAAGTVIFSDISDALLGHVHAAVAERDLLEPAQFVSMRAEDLAEIPASPPR